MPYIIHTINISLPKKTIDCSAVLHDFWTAIFSWSSKKQQTVALSTCEAGYISAAACTCQAMWLGYILGELNLAKEGGAGGREMEATEIEGEALVHQNDADSTVDPDVALAYLDEKLEHVLGHFQKDFEGGVSAENLGSKFGGYGSFLPTYQRSPTWSHARTPPKVQNHSASRSPTNLPLEAPRGNSISSSASLSGRHGLTALGMETVPPHRASSVENCVKQERTMPLANADNKADNQFDQKTFKVRIKMGSDNSSTNAVIYD